MKSRVFGSLTGGVIGFFAGAGTGIVGGVFGAIAGVLFSPQSVPPGDGAPDQTSCAQFNGGEPSDGPLISFNSDEADGRR